MKKLLCIVLYFVEPIYQGYFHALNYSEITCFVSNEIAMTSWDIMNNLSTYSIVSSVLSLSWSFTAHEAVQLKGALDFSVNAIGRFLIICSSLAQVS